MSTVAERLLEIIGARSKSEFARRCSVPESSVRQWVDGTSLPSAEKLIAIAGATGVSIDWLLLGRGSKKSIGDVADIGGSVRVPRFAVTASAGAGSINSASSEPEHVEMPSVVLEQIGLRPEFARILSASGTSMEPTVGDGDLLLVDISPRRRDPVVEGRIYVLSVGEALFVKRLRRTASGWMMSSDNQARFPDEAIPAGSPVVIHGQVVWAGRQLP